MSRDLDYENKNSIFDIQNKEHGIKCKNYEICNNILPKWWFECKERYWCTGCDMFGFGVLEISDDIDCLICLETKRGVKYPNCVNKACIECFKRCFYGNSDRSKEPVFPYPDIEDEYYDDQENSKWETDYPLIELYNLLHNAWNDKRMEEWENEEFLRKCPLCKL